MTSGQKVALSLLISVLVFCAFSVIAFSGLFDLIEVNFYQPVVQDIKQKKIEEIVSAQNEYFDTLMRRFDNFTANSDVKTYIETHPVDSSVRSRELLRSQLFTATPALKNLRIIDSNGRNIYFSTFSSDVISSKNGIAYRDYNAAAEISFDSVSANSFVAESVDSENKCRVIKDGEKNQIIFSIPFFDSNSKFRATALFYCDATNFSQFLFNRSLVDISGFASLVTNPRDSQKNLDGFGGFVFGLPNYGVSSIQNQILSKWKENPSEHFWKLEPVENDETENSMQAQILCAFSAAPSREDFGFITFLYDESELKFPQFMRILLLVTAFITFYLAIFLILSFKHDDIVVIRDKIHRYEAEFFINYKKMGEKNPTYLEEQKPVLERRILKSLGKKAIKHQAEVKSIFETWWQEMCANSGEQILIPHTQVAAPIVNAEELKQIVRSSLEEILETENGKRKTENSDESALIEEIDSAEEVEELADEVETVEEVKELADDVEELAEDLESLDEVDSVDDVNSVEDAESLDEVETADEAEELTEDSESLEDVDSVDEAEPLEELENLDEVEEVDEAESVEDIEPVEEVEEIENGKLKNENSNDVESVEDVESLADDVEELTDETEELADEAESLEEIEELAEETEELANDAESVDEIENLDEVEELTDDIDSVEEVESAEEVEELKDVESLEEVEPAEEIEELTENAESVAEAESLDDEDDIPVVEISDELLVLGDSESGQGNDGGEFDDFSTVDKIDSISSLDEIEDLHEYTEREERADEIARTLAALPEKSVDLKAREDDELDEGGLSRKFSWSEMHDIQKLHDAVNYINEMDSKLEELEPFDPTQKSESEKSSPIPSEFYIPDILKNNIPEDDDIYKDEALLEKIEFGVPSSDILNEELDDSVAENFVATAPDYSFLDEEFVEEISYKAQPQKSLTENEHFYVNTKLNDEAGEPEEVEILEGERGAVPFSFTQMRKLNV